MSNGKASYSLFPFYMSKKNVASFLAFFFQRTKKEAALFSRFRGRKKHGICPLS